MNIVKGKRTYPIEARVNSSLLVHVVPPRACRDIYLKIGKADKVGYYAPVRGAYSPERGNWECYVPPVFFPIGGITQYKVVGRDLNGFRFAVGQGILRVVADGMYDANEDVNVSAVRDCHIKMGGKWYAVRVVNDGTQLAFDVAQDSEEIQEGYIEETGDSPLEMDYSQPYAYDPGTGLYHLVTAYRDSTGTVSARVAEEGVEDAEKAFCYDSATGFWYRMDAQDVNGEESLVVGDAR